MVQGTIYFGRKKIDITITEMNSDSDTSYEELFILFFFSYEEL